MVWLKQFHISMSTYRKKSNVLPSLGKNSSWSSWLRNYYLSLQ